MTQETREVGYTFPYLFDGTQNVAKAFRAACTPDLFLFDGAQRLVYRGQFDDSRPKSPVPVTGKDLKAAVDALTRTGFLGDLISWEDGVYGTFKSVFSGGARACRSDGRGAPGGPRISVGGAAVGGTEARLHGGDAAEVGAAGAA